MYIQYPAVLTTNIVDTAGRVSDGDRLLVEATGWESNLGALFRAGHAHLTGAALPRRVHALRRLAQAAGKGRAGGRRAGDAGV